jgi:hypothetical protein
MGLLEADDYFQFFFYFLLFPAYILVFLVLYTSGLRFPRMFFNLRFIWLREEQKKNKWQEIKINFVVGKISFSIRTNVLGLVLYV